MFPRSFLEHQEKKGSGEFPSDPFFFLNLKPEACGEAAYFAGTRWGNRGAPRVDLEQNDAVERILDLEDRLVAEAPMTFMNFPKLPSA